MDSGLKLIKKTGEVLNEDLYKDLETLANVIEKKFASRPRAFGDYLKWSQWLAELRSLIFKLSKTQSGKKLSPLLARFLDLEGKVKEMRNDRRPRKL